VTTGGCAQGSFAVSWGAKPTLIFPRGTPHTWQNSGDAPARFFATITPAATSFEQFSLRYSQLPTHQRGAEAFARLAQQTQAFEVLGPPLADSSVL